jgi:epimerase EvaD
MVKYVYCPRGKALDIVVDVRVGSTTFGQWDSVVLDADELHGVYLPVGLGHGFVALEDDTVMLYLLSEGYVPKNELAVSFTDTTLGLPIPDDLEPIISERDRMAPTLAEARDKGLLPEYATCLELQAGL